MPGVSRIWEGEAMGKRWGGSGRGLVVRRLELKLRFGKNEIQLQRA